MHQARSFFREKAITKRQERWNIAPAGCAGTALYRRVELNQTQFQTHSFRTGYHCSILFSPRRARRNAKGEESGID